MQRFHLLNINKFFGTYAYKCLDRFIEKDINKWRFLEVQSIQEKYVLKVILAIDV